MLHLVVAFELGISLEPSDPELKAAYDTYKISNHTEDDEEKLTDGIRKWKKGTIRATGLPAIEHCRRKGEMYRALYLRDHPVQH